MKRMNVNNILTEINWDDIYTDIFVALENDKYEDAKRKTDLIYDTIRNELINNSLTIDNIRNRIEELINID